MEIIDNGKYGDYFSVGDFVSLKDKVKKHLKNESRLKKKAISSKKHLRKFNLKNNKLSFDKLFNII